MDITFTVESTNGKIWTAVCADPVLSVEGTDIISVCKDMAASIEEWFIDTFNTKKRVIVEVPVIKAKIKASVSVRSEKTFDEFEKDAAVKEYETEKIERPLPRPPQPAIPERVVDGPCAYISDGKGIMPVGMCEAHSDDPSDTPGIRVDDDGTCLGEFGKCQYYKPGGRRMIQSPEEESYDSPDPIDSYEDEWPSE